MMILQTVLNACSAALDGLYAYSVIIDSFLFS